MEQTKASNEKMEEEIESQLKQIKTLVAEQQQNQREVARLQEKLPDKEHQANILKHSLDAV